MRDNQNAAARKKKFLKDLGEQTEDPFASTTPMEVEPSSWQAAVTAQRQEMFERREKEARKEGDSARRHAEEYLRIEEDNVQSTAATASLSPASEPPSDASRPPSPTAAAQDPHSPILKFMQAIRQDKGNSHTP